MAGNSKSGRRGNGAGYGGPAKGAGSAKPKQTFNAATNPKGHNGLTPPALTRAELRRERADALEALLFDIAMGSERDADRVQAAKALHAICDGQPIARQEVKLAVDPNELTDAEIAAMIAQERSGANSP